jgi:hypothetical protein
MAPWRLTIASWSHHGGIFHRFLVSDTAITKNYFKRRYHGFAPALEIDQTVSNNSS